MENIMRMTRLFVLLLLALSILSVSVVFSSYTTPTPDGMIAFVDKENGCYRLNIIDPDGKNLQILKIFDNVKTPQFLSWSPDGEKIAYCLYGEIKVLLEIINIKTKTIYRVDSLEDIADIAWASDSHKIAYNHTESYYDEEYNSSSFINKIRVANIENTDKILHYDIFPSREGQINIDGEKWYTGGTYFKIFCVPSEENKNFEIVFTTEIVKHVKASNNKLDFERNNILAKVNSDGSGFKIFLQSKNASCSNAFFNDDKIAFFMGGQIKVLDMRDGSISNTGITFEAEYDNYIISNWYHNKMFVILVNDFPSGRKSLEKFITIDSENWTIKKMESLRKYDRFPEFNFQRGLIYLQTTKNQDKKKYHIFVGEKSIYSSPQEITAISIYNKS